MSDKKPRIYSMSFASVYPLYVSKVEKKGRNKDEVDKAIFWLTGYSAKDLSEIIETNISFEDFFSSAPKMNPNRKLINGKICGVQIEEIQEPLMKEIRYLDKLVDEIAKGRPMDKILRKPKV